MEGRAVLRGFHSSTSLLIFLWPHLCLPSPFADILKQMEDMKKGTWKRLREKFSAKKPEEDSK